MQMSVVNMCTKFGYSRLIPSGDIPYIMCLTNMSTWLHEINSFMRYTRCCLQLCQPIAAKQ
ncbi:hypothetical protein LDENG_00052480, partial [Lucifuga dentata]